MENLDINFSPYDEEYSSYRWKYVILLIYLYSLNKIYFFKEWGNDLWDTINKLSTEEFLRFWLEFGLIINKDKNKIEYNPKNKNYLFVNDFNIYPDEEDFNFIKTKINKSLIRLEKEGFKFEDPKF